jgi:hypothetical protein
MSGVSATPYRLTARDTLSHIHEDTSPHQVSIQPVLVHGMADEDVVATNAPCEYVSYSISNQRYPP